MGWKAGGELLALGWIDWSIGFVVFAAAGGLNFADVVAETQACVGLECSVVAESTGPGDP